MHFPPVYDRVQKFGEIPDIDATDTNEDVWDGEGAYGGFLANATAMTVSSSSTDDVSAGPGTGAHTVRVVGLDTNWQEVVQDVTMTGQTAVNLPTSLRRVYRAYVLTAGTGGVNAGNIWVGSGTVTTGVPANKYAGILANNGQTLMAVYTTPDKDQAGNSYAGARVLKWYASLGGVTSSFATIALQTRENGGAWRTRRKLGVAEGGPVIEEITWGIDVGTKTDIRVRVVTNGANNTLVQAGFDVALIK